MTDDPRVEELAKMLAAAHGAAVLYYKQGAVTVAASCGFGSWGHSPGLYADKHWREYRLAAELVIEKYKKAG